MTTWARRPSRPRGLSRATITLPPKWNCLLSSLDGRA